MQIQTSAFHVKPFLSILPNDFFKNLSSVLKTILFFEQYIQRQMIIPFSENS